MVNIIGPGCVSLVVPEEWKASSSWRMFYIAAATVTDSVARPEFGRRAESSSATRPAGGRASSSVG